MRKYEQSVCWIVLYLFLRKDWRIVFPSLKNETHCYRKLALSVHSKTLDDNYCTDKLKVKKGVIRLGSRHVGGVSLSRLG